MRAARLAVRAAMAIVGAGALAVTAAPGRAPAASKLRCPGDSVPISGGTFPIGTTWSQDYDAEEQPRRMFTLTRPYCLDRTEVTVAVYRACASTGACAERTPFFAGDALPMTNVSWHDARAACAARGGRLPTEVEWEHAARGPDDRLYPWGSYRPDCARADYWDETSGNCGGYGPSRVGSMPQGASPYGVLDMAGNVLEWVDDAWDPRPWSSAPLVDPHRANPSALRHAVRGGSWDYDVVHSLRVSDRDGYPSELRDATLGFRCAYEPLP